MLRRLVVPAVLIMVAPACRTSLEDEPLQPDADMTMPDGQTRRCRTQTSSACMTAAAENKSDLTWIQANVFQPNCGGNSCHGPGSPMLRTVRFPDAATTHSVLVNKMAESDGVTDRTLVVPGNVNQSYLMVLMRHIEPSQADPPMTAEPPPLDDLDNGYMPLSQTGDPVCCQKLDAVARWIEAGAPMN